MSDISTGRAGGVALDPSKLEAPQEQAHTHGKGALNGRSAYEAHNSSARARLELNYARSLIQTRSEAVAAMYARTATSAPSKLVNPRTLGKAVSIAVGSGASSGRMSAIKMDKPLSERSAKNVGGSRVRFAGLKKLGHSISQKLSSMFSKVRSEPKKSSAQFHDLPAGLRKVIKEHEQVQEKRYAVMRAKLEARDGKYDERTQKFANLFAKRMEHYDNLAVNYKKERLVTYRQIRKETEALLEESKGKVFTPDEKYHTMLRNLTNMSNLFFQDMDMELFELMTMDK